MIRFSLSKNATFPEYKFRKITVYHKLILNVKGNRILLSVELNVINVSK